MVKQLHNVPSVTKTPKATTTQKAAMERLWSLALSLSEAQQHGLAERGITLARANLLWQLNERGASTQRFLSQVLRVTPRNVTGLVDALEADGLVTRTPHPTDRRATLVTLTDRGAAVAAGMQADNENFARVLFGEVTPAELSSFVKVVDRVLVRVREMLPPTS